MSQAGSWQGSSPPGSSDSTLEPRGPPWLPGAGTFSVHRSTPGPHAVRALPPFLPAPAAQVDKMSLRGATRAEASGTLSPCRYAHLHQGAPVSQRWMSGAGEGRRGDSRLGFIKFGGRVSTLGRRDVVRCSRGSPAPQGGSDPSTGFALVAAGGLGGRHRGPLRSANLSWAWGLQGGCLWPASLQNTCWGPGVTRVG